MTDYRSMVPRTPPEGLTEWAKDDLAMEALLYQAEWVPEAPLAPLMEERKPKKIKMVRVWCSACGEEEWFPWCESATCHGMDYGFIHPGYPDGRGESGLASSGDETVCPMCGCPVKVKKAAELGYGWFVADETMKMSAAVLENGALALTGWSVQRRVYRNGRSEIKAQPYDAYVFDREGCAKLTGWVNAYSGTAGYFVSYKREWGQPRDWSEGWGQDREIFGLTRELVERSQLPNCHLYEYMTTGWTDKAPVAYLRLYQAYPNVENLVLSGLPAVLDELIEENMLNHIWENNKKGAMEIPEINWNEMKPAKMLGLTREELRLGQAMGWGVLWWRLYCGAKARGEILTEEDIRNASYLGEDEVLELVGQGPVGKSLAYLLQQIEFCAVNPEIDDYIDPTDIINVTMLLDYWAMCRELGYDLGDRHICFPQNLCVAHDKASAAAKAALKRTLPGRFRRRRRELAKYIFRANGLVIRPAASQAELNDEAKQLSHCVWSYAESHAKGETAIFFIRYENEPEKSYFTLELDEKKLKVRQNRGKGNCARTAEVKAFENLWLAWVRAGCRRDEAGEPVMPEEETRTA